MDNRYRYVGKSIPRIDAVEKVTGEAKYAPDLKLDNMLYARLLRSPHAHARIVAIDASRALEDPRVKAVVTIEEMPKVVGTWFSLRSEKARKRLYLKDQVVRFIGDPVLAVAAEDEESANAALARDAAQAENASIEKRRYDLLLEKGVVPKEQSDQMRTNDKAAAAAVNADQAAIDSTNEAIRADRAAVDQAEVQLSYCNIYSPIDGRAGVLMVDRGNIVKANDAAMVVINQTQPI